MSASPSVLQVVILRDGLLVGTEVFVPGSYTLGSSADSELRLEDPGVEAHHAVLYFQNGRAAIQDSGTREGVYVNGHRITACEIRPVDEVTCGPFSLKVRVLAQKSSKAPAEVAALLERPPTPPLGQGHVTTGSGRVPLSKSLPSSGRTTVPSAPPHQPSSPPAAPRAAARPPSPPVGTAVSPRRPPPAGPAGAGTALSARKLAALAAPAISPTPQPVLIPSRQMPMLRAVTPLPFSIEGEPTQSIIIDAELMVSLPPPSERRSSKSRAAPPARTPPGKSRTVTAPAGLEPKQATAATRLFVELYWGETRTEARSFAEIAADKPVTAAPHEGAAVPMWGFCLPDAPFVLAEKGGHAYRVFVPPGSAVERREGDGNYYPVAAAQLESVGGRSFVMLEDGSAVRFSEGELSLVAYVQPPLERPRVPLLSGLPWLAMFCFLFFGAAFAAFLVYGPQALEQPDFQRRNMPKVAIRLIAPEPKKKEAARKKLEAIKQLAPQKVAAAAAEKTVAPKAKERQRPQAAAPSVASSRALKALEKLTAAAPISELLGPPDAAPLGLKTAKGAKLSGLLGKAPVANAGLGALGIGSGAGNSGGTRGAEILRGKGGERIGAFGVGTVGRGAVGGQVTRASARSIGVQGSIDREAVAKAVNSHLQEVRGCYERALLKEPGLSGKVVLEWTVSTAGKVVTAKTKTSTLRNAAVEGCILQSLKGWQFPSAKGGVVIVSYPFLFNSVGY